MSGQIPAAFIADLLSRVDLAALVSEVVTLKKSGFTFQGRCPFHEEKSPSFHVYHNASPSHYHCYGCGAHGDAISFLRESSGLSFNGAVEQLASRHGMEIPRDQEDRERLDRLRVLYQANETAARRYRDALKTHPARHIALDYLQKRGISPEMAELYGIGFAPPGRTFLCADADPVLLEAMLTLKLVIRNEKGQFDLFQNRLMFPIRNTSGKTVAFGGRTLGNDRSKYINSPESPVFRKSRELYGAKEARRPGVKQDFLLVVEGYIDVISLAQEGLGNTVATLGTATNEDNLRHLLNTSNNIIFCFDGDKAGLAAADKAMRNTLTLFRDGLQVNFLILPDGEDPDTLVRREGGDAFMQRLTTEATPLSKYFFQSLARDLDMTIAEHRGILKDRASTILKTLNAPILKNALYEELRTYTHPYSAKGHFSGGERRNFIPASPPPPVSGSSTLFFSLGLYADPKQAPEYEALLDYFVTRADDKRAVLFLRWIIGEKIQSTEDLLYRLAVSEKPRSFFADMFDGPENLPSGEILRKAAEDSLFHLRKSYLDATWTRLNDALRAAPGDKSLHEKYKRFARERMQLENGYRSAGD